VLWSAFENGSGALIAFLGLVVFAKLLSPSDFGVFSVCLAVVELAAIFTNMFFHDALIQRHEVTDAHFHAAFTASLALAAIVYALLWLVFPGVAELVKDGRAADVGRVLGLGLLVTGPAGILAARQGRNFGFRVLAIRTLAGRLCGFALGLISLFLGFGLWALVVQQLAVMVLGSAALLVYGAADVRFRVDVAPIRDLLGYSLASMTSLSTVVVAKRLFVFSAGVFLGTEKAGLLSLAFRLIDTVWAVSATAVSQVLLPTLCRLQQDRTRLLNAYRMSLRMALTVLVPAFAALGVLAPELVGWLFGSKWVPAAPYMVVLSVLTFVQVPRLPGTLLLSATRHLKEVSWINVLALAYMAAAIGVTRLPSAYVALAVWSGGEMLTSLCVAIVLRQRLGIRLREQIAVILGPLAAPTLMMLSVHVARSALPGGMSALSRLLVLGLVAVGTYGSFMLAFGRRYLIPILGMARVALARH